MENYTQVLEGLLLTIFFFFLYSTQLIYFLEELVQFSSLKLYKLSFTTQSEHSWFHIYYSISAAAAKSLQSCLTLCDPIDRSPPGSPIPGILQARTLEWVATSFSNVWKWSHSVMSDSSQPHGLQQTRLLHPWDFPGKSTGVGFYCLLQFHIYIA